jgi:hypothetical protein
VNNDPSVSLPGSNSMKAKAGLNSKSHGNLTDLSGVDAPNGPATWCLPGSDSSKARAEQECKSSGESLDSLTS